MVKVHVRYFASLREEAGHSQEELSTEASTAEALYGELKERYSFRLDSRFVRAAVNDEFRPMATALSDGDTVVFIPPVAGG